MTLSVKTEMTNSSSRSNRNCLLNEVICICQRVNLKTDPTVHFATDSIVTTNSYHLEKRKGITTS